MHFQQNLKDFCAAIVQKVAKNSEFSVQTFEIYITYRYILSKFVQWIAIQVIPGPMDPCMFISWDVDTN